MTRAFLLHPPVRHQHVCWGTPGYSPSQEPKRRPDQSRGETRARRGDEQRERSYNRGRHGRSREKRADRSHDERNAARDDKRPRREDDRSRRREVTADRGRDRETEQSQERGRIHRESVKHDRRRDESEKKDTRDVDGGRGRRHEEEPCKEPTERSSTDEKACMCVDAYDILSWVLLSASRLMIVAPSVNVCLSLCVFRSLLPVSPRFP